MSAVRDVAFGYRICPVEGGWSWTAFDPSGRLAASGEAPTKALAAACVIRALARASAAPAALKSAA